MPDRELFDAWVNVPGEQKVHIDAVKASKIYETALEKKLLALHAQLSNKEIIGADASDLKQEMEVLKKKHAAIKEVDVSGVDVSKDLSANRAKLDELSAKLGE